MSNRKQFKYFAFISYNSRDIKWGKRIQKKLEGYRLPSTMCSEHGWDRKPMKPVFFAPTDIQPGGLTAELQERLKASKHLIVICSPNSAKSQWVGKEIAFFHSLGRPENIHFFIVDGIPNSEDPDSECYNPVIKELELPEILGANIHEKIYRWPWLNKQRAYVQLITKLLGVEFDSIWERHKRLLFQKIALCLLGIISIVLSLFCVYLNTRPVDINISLYETTVKNDSLPPLKDAILTLYLDNETKTTTIHALGDKTKFPNVPHNAIGKSVRLTAMCQNWVRIDTTFRLAKEIKIGMARDPHCYGDVTFRLWSVNRECGIANIKLNLAGQEVRTDDNGFINIFIPLERQNIRYLIKSELELEDSILTMPTTSSTALLIKE